MASEMMYLNITAIGIDGVHKALDFPVVLSVPREEAYRMLTPDSDVLTAFFRVAAIPSQAVTSIDVEYFEV